MPRPLAHAGINSGVRRARTATATGGGEVIPHAGDMSTHTWDRACQGEILEIASKKGQGGLRGFLFAGRGRRALQAQSPPSIRLGV
jgi:hypothetical protein